MTVTIPKLMKDLPLPTRARNIIRYSHYGTRPLTKSHKHDKTDLSKMLLGNFCEFITVNDMLRREGCGVRTVMDIKEALAAEGYQWAESFKHLIKRNPQVPEPVAALYKIAQEDEDVAVIIQKDYVKISVRGGWFSIDKMFDLAALEDMNISTVNMWYDFMSTAVAEMRRSMKQQVRESMKVPPKQELTKND